jgi:hypothetical protein
MPPLKILQPVSVLLFVPSNVSGDSNDGLLSAMGAAPHRALIENTSKLPIAKPQNGADGPAVKNKRPAVFVTFAFITELLVLDYFGIRTIKQTPNLLCGTQNVDNICLSTKFV